MAACKRCGAGIAGAELCADCEATAAIWHVAVGEVAHGPYTRDELLSFRKTDRLGAESFVHREGWPSWQRCADVAELREPASVLPAIPVAAPQAAHAPAPARVAPESVAAPLKAAMGHDPFADSDGGDAQEEVTRHGRIPRAALDNASAKSWDLDHVPALAALSASSRAASPQRADDAGEGSGVLRVASLIQASARAAQDPTMRSVMDGRLVHARQRTQARLSRAQVERVRPSVLMGLALAGLLLGTGSILAWSVAGGSGKSSPELKARANAAVADAARLASASPAAAQAPSQPMAAASPAVAALKPPPRDTTPEIVIDEATAYAHDRATADDDARRDRAGRAKAARVNRWQAKRAARLAAKARRASRLAAKRAAASDDAFASAPKRARSDDEEELSPRSKRTDKDQSLDDLVAGALSAKPTPTKQAQPSEAESDDSTLPETPSRDEMLAALSRAKSLVAKCKGSGMATVSINLRGPAGRASKVSVEGVDGSSRSCVQSAIKRTSFPKFQQEDFAVKAPFKLQES